VPTTEATTGPECIPIFRLMNLQVSMVCIEGW